MAIYHFSAQIISRSEGRSSVAAAAYRSGSKLHDERTGLTHDFSRKSGIAYSEILAPVDAPAWVTNRESLWNEVEQVERRRDAQLSREINIALPIELTLAQQVELTRSFVNDVFVSHGMVADINLHLDNPDNPHVHIMLSLRDIDAEGFQKKNRQWNDRVFIHWQRAQWAHYANHALARAGHGARIDHRTLAEQGIERDATVHLGPAVCEMEARGIETERGNFNRRAMFGEVREAQVEQLMNRAIEKLTIKYSVFERKEVIRVLHRQSMDSLYLSDPERVQIATRLLRDQRIVRLKNTAGQVRYTTRATLEAEQRILSVAQQKSQLERFAVAGHVMDVVRDRFFFLSPEAQEALEHITATNGFAVVEGLPGVGKTTLLRAANQAWRGMRYDVVGVAFGGKAAREMRSGADIKNARTIHSLLYALDLGRESLTKKSVVVIDEAGMVPTYLLDRLLEKADKAQCKVVMIGDRRQLPAIDAGGSFAMLADRHGAKDMTDIQRQNEAWARDSVKDFAEGRAEEALERYLERGQVVVRDTLDDTLHDMMRRWQYLQTAHPDQSVALYAGTRRDVARLNHLAREALIRDQRLGESRIVINTPNGSLEIREGERLLITRNNRDLDINNGQLGVVEQVRYTMKGHTLNVRLDDQRRIEIDTQAFNHINYGYAMTTHKSQGATVDHAIVLAGWMHKRELTTVSLSRHRDSATVFINANGQSHEKALSTLVKQMAQSEQKMTATEYQNQPITRNTNHVTRQRDD